MRILITSANSAKAYQLKNKLKTDNIILGDYLELPDLMLRTGHMIRLPHPRSGSYAHQMLTISLDNDVDKIYPLRGEEAELLKEAEQLFKEYNIEVEYP